MKRRYLIPLLVLLALGLTALPACLGGGVPSAFYDAGAQDLTATAAQFVQYWLFRFDTSAAARTLTIPNASDLTGAITSPAVGQIVVIAVTADGANPVNVRGGTGVTVKPAATTVAGNTTVNLYCVLTNVSSGSQAITVY